MGGSAPFVSRRRKIRFNIQGIPRRESGISKLDFDPKLPLFVILRIVLFIFLSFLKTVLAGILYSACAHEERRNFILDCAGEISTFYIASRGHHPRTRTSPRSV